jgi:hypothetical protein
MRAICLEFKFKGAFGRRMRYVWQGVFVIYGANGVDARGLSVYTKNKSK